MKTQATSCPFFENGREVCRSDLTLSNVFGHDMLGHKIANAMCREEKRTVEAIAALSDDEILGIRTMGMDALARIRKSLGRPPVKIDGPEAVQALLDSIPEGPEWNHGQPVNNWEAATEAVAGANEETVRAALARLLALHLFELQMDYPTVAFRNIRAGDMIVLGGGKHWVVGQPEHRGEHGETIYLKVRPAHLPLAEAQDFAYGRDVRVELVYRPEESARPRVPQDASVKQTVRDLVRQVIDSGALPADFELFGDYGRNRIPGLNTLTLNKLYNVFGEMRSDAKLSDLLEVSDVDLFDIRGFGQGCMDNLKDSLLALLKNKES